MEAGLRRLAPVRLSPVRSLGYSKYLLSIVCLSLNAACSLLPVNNPDSSAEPLLEEISAVAITRHPVPVMPTPDDPILESTMSPVALIVSRDIPAYSGVAARLYELMDPTELTTWILEGPTDGPPTDADQLAELITAEQPRSIVAVGLPAALFAIQKLNVPTIFCQVFNQSEYPELEQAIAAVSALPEFSNQLQFWRSVDTGLSSVGAIIGPGHEDLVASSQQAADEQEIAFTYRVSRSDQETVYLFKRLATDIDGFWLVPDNRILSVAAIEELMAYADARRIPVVVSNPGLLRFGALMSMAPSPAQVADSVYDLLRETLASFAGAIRNVAPSDFDVEVNPTVAARLGIGLD